MADLTSNFWQNAMLQNQSNSERITPGWPIRPTQPLVQQHGNNYHAQSLPIPIYLNPYLQSQFLASLAANTPIPPPMLPPSMLPHTDIEPAHRSIAQATPVSVDGPDLWIFPANMIEAYILGSVSLSDLSTLQTRLRQLLRTIAIRKTTFAPSTASQNHSVTTAVQARPADSSASTSDVSTHAASSTPNAGRPFARGRRQRRGQQSASNHDRNQFQTSDQRTSSNASRSAVNDPSSAQSNSNSRNGPIACHRDPNVSLLEFKGDFSSISLNTIYRALEQYTPVLRSLVLRIYVDPLTTYLAFYLLPTASLSDTRALVALLDLRFSDHRFFPAPRELRPDSSLLPHVAEIRLPTASVATSPETLAPNQDYKNDPNTALLEVAGDFSDTTSDQLLANVELLDNEYLSQLVKQIYLNQHKTYLAIYLNGLATLADACALLAALQLDYDQRQYHSAPRITTSRSMLLSTLRRHPSPVLDNPSTSAHATNLTSHSPSPVVLTGPSTQPRAGSAVMQTGSAETAASIGAPTNLVTPIAGRDYRVDSSVHLLEVADDFRNYSIDQYYYQLRQSPIRAKVLRLYLSPSRNYLALYLASDLSGPEVGAILDLFKLRGRDLRFHRAPRPIDRSHLLLSKLDRISSLQRRSNTDQVPEVTAEAIISSLPTSSSSKSTPIVHTAAASTPSVPKSTPTVPAAAVSTSSSSKPASSVQTAAASTSSSSKPASSVQVAAASTSSSSKPASSVQVAAASTSSSSKPASSVQVLTRAVFVPPCLPSSIKACIQPSALPSLSRKLTGLMSCWPIAHHTRPTQLSSKTASASASSNSSPNVQDPTVSASASLILSPNDQVAVVSVLPSLISSPNDQVAVVSASPSLISSSNDQVAVVSASPSLISSPNDQVAVVSASLSSKLSPRRAALGISGVACAHSFFMPNSSPSSIPLMSRFAKLSPSLRLHPDLSSSHNDDAAFLSPNQRLFEVFNQSSSLKKHVRPSSFPGLLDAPPSEPTLQEYYATNDFRSGLESVETLEGNIESILKGEIPPALNSRLHHIKSLLHVLESRSSPRPPISAYDATLVDMTQFAIRKRPDGYKASRTSIDVLDPSQYPSDLEITATVAVSQASTPTATPYSLPPSSGLSSVIPRYSEVVDLTADAETATIPSSFSPAGASSSAWSTTRQPIVSVPTSTSRSKRAKSARPQPKDEFMQTSPPSSRLLDDARTITVNAAAAKRFPAKQQATLDTFLPRTITRSRSKQL